MNKQTNKDIDMDQELLTELQKEFSKALTDAAMLWEEKDALEEKMRINHNKIFALEAVLEPSKRKGKLSYTDKAEVK